jgi:hypothetical protein
MICEPIIDPWTTCAIHRCQKRARSARGRICEAHYYRVRRGVLVRKYRSSRAPYHRKGGYVILWDPAHPLADDQGLIYEHRRVLFEAIGIGPHSCHWCKATVSWLGHGGQLRLVVDHLDDRKANNDLANLVPSCHRCNSARGNFMAWARHHRDDPFLVSLYKVAIYDYCSIG